MSPKYNDLTRASRNAFQTSPASLSEIAATVHIIVRISRQRDWDTGTIARTSTSDSARALVDGSVRVCRTVHRTSLHNGLFKPTKRMPRGSSQLDAHRVHTRSHRCQNPEAFERFSIVRASERRGPPSAQCLLEVRPSGGSFAFGAAPGSRGPHRICPAWLRAASRWPGPRTSLARRQSGQGGESPITGRDCLETFHVHQRCDALAVDPTPWDVAIQDVRPLPSNLGVPTAETYRAPWNTPRRLERTLHLLKMANSHGPNRARPSEARKRGDCTPHNPARSHPSS